MERTLDIMMEELKLAREEKEPLLKAIKIIDEKITELNDEIKTYKLNNGLYHPMSELVDYIGKHIESITLVERDKWGKLDTDCLYCEEIFEVDEHGRLYYSSYDSGIIRYDNKTHKYVHMYYGSKIYHDYVGFLEISIDEDYDYD